MAIEARWWKKGRRRRSMAAAVRIQSECALTSMNASSGQNLSDALMANENVTRTRVEPRGALDGVTDTARLRRTNVTCIWGVSDPLQLDHGAKKGAAKWGSPHAPLVTDSGADICMDGDGGGIERRPLTSDEVQR
jgi:hypothetical protein